MAKRKGERADWEVDFIGIPLNDGQMKQLMQFDLDGHHAMKMLESILLEGCKVSISAGRFGSSMSVNITVPNPKGSGRKRCFASHAPTVFDALRCMTFKIDVILDGQVANIYEAQDEDSAWG